MTDDTMAGAQPDMARGTGELTVFDDIAANHIPGGALPRHDKFDPAGFQRELSFVQEALRQAKVERVELPPSSWEIMTAAFRSGNTVASALSSETLSERLFPSADAREMPVEEVIAKMRRDGMDAYADRFTGILTDKQYDAMKRQIEREIADQRTLQMAGVGGVAASLMAGFIDVPTLIPMGGVAKAIGAGQTMARTATTGIVGGAVGGAVTEAGLQTSQETRTLFDSASSIAASAVIGGVLGAGAHALIGPVNARNVETRLDDLRKDASEGFAAGRSAGAAHLSELERMRARGVEANPRVPSFKAFETIEALGKTPFLGQYIRNPKLELERGATLEERAFIKQFVYDDSISLANARAAETGADSTAGKNPLNVQAVFDQFHGAYAEATRNLTDLYRQNKGRYASRDDFAAQVANALVNGDRHSDKIVEQAARSVRARVFEPIRKRMIENSSYTLELGDPKNATSYFPHVVDVEAVRADKEAYIEFYTGMFGNDLGEQVRLAKLDRETRRSEQFDIRAELKGVRVRVPDGFDAATGKARFKTEVRKEGELDTLEGQIKAEHDANISAIRTTREQTLTAFDAQAKASKTAARADLDKELDALKTKRDAEFAELRETAAEMRQGEVTRKDIAVIRAQTKEAEAKVSLAHERSVKAAERKHKPTLDKLSREITSERRDIENRFARLTDEAKTARDDSLTDVRDQIEADLAARSEALGYDPRILKRLSNEAAIEKEAARLAEQRYQTVVRNNGFILDHELTSATPNFMKKRRDPAWHAELMRRGWAKTDVFDIMEHYVRNAGTDASIGTIFKKPGKPIVKEDGSTVAVEIGDYNLSHQIKLIRDSYEPAIQGAQADAKVIESISFDPRFADAAKRQEALNTARAKEEVRLVNARDRAIANVEVLRDMARGTRGGDPRMHKAAEIVGTVNYMRLMGGTNLSALGDPINIALANGFGTTMRNGILPMLRDFENAWKNANSDLRRLSRITLANAEAELNIRNGALADIGNPFAKGDPATTWFRNAGKTFTRYTGIEFWNSFWKQVSFNTVQARVLDDAMRGWGQLSKGERAWLLNNTIDETGLERIRIAYSGQGSKTSAGIPVARFDDWADQEAATMFRSLVSAESRRNVVTPTFADKMAFTADPALALIAQFRTHMFANQMKLIGRQVQLARVNDDRQEVLGVYLGLFSIAMMGAVVDAAKHMAGSTTITRGSTDPKRSPWQRVVDEWEKTPGQALYNALDRASLFGPVWEGSNMLEKMGMPSIRGGMAIMFHDDPGSRKDAARFMNRSVFEAALGPTAGFAEDVRSVVRFGAWNIGAALGTNDPDLPSRADYRKARRMIWGQNAPIIQQILNEGEARLGTAYNWPAPK